MAILNTGGGGGSVTVPALQALGVPLMVGSDTTERTSAATGANAGTLSSVTGLSIAAGLTVRITAKIRKTAGAASEADLGIAINGTVVLSTATGDISFGSQNEAQFGVLDFKFVVGDHDNTYGLYSTGFYAVSTAGGVARGGSTLPASDVVIPAGPITSINLTSDAKDAAQSVVSDEFYVYAG